MTRPRKLHRRGDDTDRAWPALLDEDRWLTPAMDERLRTSERSPDEMRARARELREQVRDAALALAERYQLSPVKPESLPHRADGYDHDAVVTHVAVARADDDA